MRIRTKRILFSAATGAYILIVFAFLPAAQGHDCGECEQWDTEAEACVPCACGDEPTQEQRERFEDWFPNLEWGEWSITGDANNVYNCISWSVGITDDWTWWEVDQDAKFGDQDWILEESDFDGFYDYYGYESCTEAEAEIQLYKRPGAEAPTNPDGITHAARTTDYGMWESKCGGWEKIDHMRDALNDSSEAAVYGEHVRDYKRK